MNLISIHRISRAPTCYRRVLLITGASILDAARHNDDVLMARGNARGTPWQYHGASIVIRPTRSFFHDALSLPLAVARVFE